MKQFKKDFVSVIVPCYNVERFLPDCFASIESQTFKNFEAIFVDDGSVDGTLKLLQGFCANKPNCHVISKPNAGLSSARNAGLAIAQGEFVYFVDSDDYFDPRTLEVSTKLLKSSGADVCVFKTKTVRDGKKAHFSNMNKISIRSARNAKQKIVEGTDVLVSMYFARRLNLAVWNKLYRHEILKKFPSYPQIFQEDLLYSEDTEFAYTYLKNSSKAICLNLRLYCYRRRSGSLIRSPYDEQKYRIFEVMERIEHQSQSEPALTYIRSLKTTMAYEALCRSVKSGGLPSEKIEEAYSIFKAGMWCAFKGRKNFFNIRISPFLLPYVWINKKKALKKSKKRKTIS